MSTEKKVEEEAEEEGEEEEVEEEVEEEEEDKPSSTIKSKPLLRTTKFLTDLEKRLKIKLRIHSESAQYYDRRNMSITLPSIIITSFSGIASFLGTSSYITSESAKNTFSLSVGMMASVSTLLQAFSSSLKWNVKADIHRTAAEEFSKILIKVRFELGDPENNSSKFIDEIEQKLLEIQNNCKYFAPNHIINKWDPLD